HLGTVGVAIPLGYVVRFRSFLSLRYFDLYLIAFLQALIAFASNGAVVDKYVRSILTSDKTVPLGVVEPLYCAFHTLHLRASTYRHALSRDVSAQIAIFMRVVDSVNRVHYGEDLCL